CGIPGCAAIPSCIPGKFEKGTFDGYTWSATFPTNSVPTHIAETEFSTLNKIQNLHTEPSVVPNIEQCDCEHVPEYDPVYASIRMLTGSGIGYNRSRTVLCNASAENLGNITPEGCPIRELEYLVHINRITESHTINRSKNVKSKN
ncbi:MAG: hypothetical protein KAH01_07680, partial [Caldisericia bacterium]|nr:hypothetical protein [Caldisericia bacterium]